MEFPLVATPLRPSVTDTHLNTTYTHGTKTLQTSRTSSCCETNINLFTQTHCGDLLPFWGHNGSTHDVNLKGMNVIQCPRKTWKPDCVRLLFECFVFFLVSVYMIYRLHKLARNIWNKETQCPRERSSLVLKENAHVGMRSLDSASG